MPKQRPPFDTIRYEALKAQGLTGRAIAKEMSMPEATLRDNLRMMQKAQASHGLPQEDQGILASPQQGDTGTPQASSHWASQGDIGIPQGPPEGYPNLPEGLPMGDLGIPHVENSEVHQGTPEVSHGSTPEGDLGTPPLYVHPGIPDACEESPVGGEDIEGVHEGIPTLPLAGIPEGGQGGPSEALSPELVEAITAAWPDLQRMLDWWRDRQRYAQKAPEKLERVTYHVAPKWIEAVKREADLAGDSYAAVVNRAFAAYFGVRST